MQGYRSKKTLVEEDGKGSMVGAVVVGGGGWLHQSLKSLCSCGIYLSV